MKKLLLLAGIAALFAAGSASAQEAVAIENVPCGTRYFTTKTQNWFLEIGAGISLPMVEKPDGAKREITANYGVGFGKWFSPYLGWRIEAQGGSKHWGYAKDKMAGFRAVNGNFDLMWDMSASIAGVNSKRVLSVVPFVGLGATYCWKEHPAEAINVLYRENEWLFPVSAGIQFRFRLSNVVDFFVQGRASFYGDSYNNLVQDKTVDVDITALGGFTFNLGGREFNSFNPCDYTDYIANLNGQVNALRGELAATAAALAAANAQLPCPEVVAQEVIIEQAAPLLATVRFRIDSARISNEEKVNVYNVAEWMKANPDQNVVVTGYADKDTGTSSYNMALSQRRAESVYNMLVNEYGIDSNRLATVAAGSDVQPYSVNNWNRIVVFSVAE